MRAVPPQPPEAFSTQLKVQLENNDSEETHLLGSHSSFSLSPLFSFPHDLKRPQVLALASETEIQLFTKALHFFTPDVKVHCLTEFDISPYTQLYPHPKVICGRMNWLHKAQNAKPGEIFLATIKGLAQLTLPVEFLKEHTQTFHLGDTIPDTFPESSRVTVITLSAIQKTQVPIQSVVGL